MDDRTWYLSLGTLAAAVLAMVLDASLTSFNVPPTYYPFLGVFAGSWAGYRLVKGRKNGNGNGITDDDGPQ